MLHNTYFIMLLLNQYSATSLKQQYVLTCEELLFNIHGYDSIKKLGFDTCCMHCNEKHYIQNNWLEF